MSSKWVTQQEVRVSQSEGAKIDEVRMIRVDLVRFLVSCCGSSLIWKLL